MNPLQSNLEGIFYIDFLYKNKYHDKKNRGERMRCIYCACEFDNEEDFKLHLEYSHYMMPDVRKWLRSDLSNNFGEKK